MSKPGLVHSETFIQKETHSKTAEVLERDIPRYITPRRKHKVENRRVHVKAWSHPYEITTDSPFLTQAREYHNTTKQANNFYKHKK